MHNLLFCAHTLCMNYVTNTFLSVSSSVRGKQLLCFVHYQGQKREQKHTTKNFVEFHNHSPLLTMYRLNIFVLYLILLLFLVTGGLRKIIQTQTIVPISEAALGVNYSAVIYSLRVKHCCVMSFICCFFWLLCCCVETSCDLRRHHIFIYAQLQCEILVHITSFKCPIREGVYKF